jgi:hypothetical protein
MRQLPASQQQVDRQENGETRRHTLPDKRVRFFGEADLS